MLMGAGSGGEGFFFFFFLCYFNICIYYFNVYN